MGFKKGYTPWMKGRKHSEESKKKMRESHKGQVPWNKGKKTGSFLSEEARKNISIRMKGENNPFLSKNRTEEFKQKQQEALKGKIPWNKGKKCPQTSKTMMGHTVSEETKEKLSTFMKQKYENGFESPFRKGHTIRNTGRTRYTGEYGAKRKGITNIELYGEQKAKEITIKLRTARLKQIYPKEDTSIEVAVQEELDRRGIVYEKHLPVCDVCQPDIVFPEKKIAIQCDGDYWHSLPNMIEKDRRQDKILRERGWVILRFSGSEIRDDVSSCVNRIEGVINCIVNH